MGTAYLLVSVLKAIWLLGVYVRGKKNKPRSEFLFMFTTCVEPNEVLLQQCIAKGIFVSIYLQKKMITLILAGACRSCSINYYFAKVEVGFPPFVIVVCYSAHVAL